MFFTKTTIPSNGTTLIFFPCEVEFAFLYGLFQRYNKKDPILDIRDE